MAKLWAEGVIPDCKQLLCGRLGKRISLPTYPFADRRHWAQGGPLRRQELGSAAPLHPLLDTNESTFERQIFKKTFHERDFFIHDHVVANVPTLPGVAYLELARKAGEIAAGRRVRKIKNIVYMAPIAVQNSVPREVLIELILTGRQFDSRYSARMGKGRNYRTRRECWSTRRRRKMQAKPNWSMWKRCAAGVPR